MSDVDDAEARFWAIKRECEGHPIKTLRAMPAVMRALRDLFNAYLQEAKQ